MRYWKQFVMGIVLGAALVYLAGCANMTEREKQTVWIVGGIVVGAVIISSGGKDSVAAGCTESIIVGPDGSDRVCR